MQYVCPSHASQWICSGITSQLDIAVDTAVSSS